LLGTGDRVGVEHVAKYMPWSTGWIVKGGIAHYATDAMTPQWAWPAVRGAAAQAVKDAAKAKPFTFEPPLRLEIDTTHAEQADFIELMPGYQRINGRTVRFEAASYPDIFRAFTAAFRLGGAANVRA